MTDRLLSLCIPMHNEEHNISALHEALTTVLRSIPGHAYEIICVDDGSTDRTLHHLHQLADIDTHVRVIELSRNFGKEAALTAALDHAIGDAIIPFDADLQDPVELIPELVDTWRKGADVVLARRTDRSADSYFKRKTAQIFYSIHNNLSALKIPHNVGDFRLMDRRVVDAVRQLPERQRFLKGIFAYAGFKAATIDYKRIQRHAGESKFSGWRLWNFALEGITSFSTAPLRIWLYLGAFGAMASLVYATFIIIYTLSHGADVPGYASLLVAVIFFGSIQLIGIGILGEYIGRIYMETKQRPTYIIRSSYRRSDST
ncbi:UNVERIFIED_CONTAM: gtrB [Trichonephila clavipes]